MKSLKVSLFAFAATVLFSVSANAQEKKAAVTPAITTTPAPQKPTTPVKWKEEIFDFGDIKKGTPVSHDFTFVNTTKQTVLSCSLNACVEHDVNEKFCSTAVCTIRACL